jgi:hypothetical protein
MFLRPTLVNPELLTHTLMPDHYMGYFTPDDTEVVAKMRSLLPGLCSLMSTLGPRLVISQIPGKGRDFAPVNLNLDTLIENEYPFWIHGVHKHHNACEGCGGACARGILTASGREMVSLLGLTIDDLPEFVRRSAMKDLGLGLVAKQVKNMLLG